MPDGTTTSLAEARGKVKKASAASESADLEVGGLEGELQAQEKALNGFNN
jgi:hypothetical protein